jgi:hypothetical protein
LAHSGSAAPCWRSRSPSPSSAPGQGRKEALIALITAWSLLAIHRSLIKVPLLGARFTPWRIVLCLPLPLVVGVLAGALPGFLD